MEIPFVKMHGLGNDFVVIDERETAYDLNATQVARIADRRFGVGCDQILVLSRSSFGEAAARYRIFNADGTAAEHCGNGIRCVARYLRDRDGISGSVVLVEINGEVFDLTFVDDVRVRVNMGLPNFTPSEIPIRASARAAHYDIELDGVVRRFGCVSMGNPHAVTMVEDVECAAVDEIGQALQAHEFFPARVNVGFMQIVNRGRFRLRVFERGVGETPACGTGACAAMAVGRQWGGLDENAVAELRGGSLELQWSGDDADALFMCGPAAYVFGGIIKL